MLVAGNYGYFRDELYYIADGHHLQAGYVDQPLLMGGLPPSCASSLATVWSPSTSSRRWPVP
jgi:hypothetical protein